MTYLLVCQQMENGIATRIDARVEDNDLIEQFRNDGSLRAAVNACLWGKLNRLMIEFVENKTLAEFVQECRNQTCDEWDMYTI